MKIKTQHMKTKGNIKSSNRKCKVINVQILKYLKQFNLILQEVERKITN